MNIRDFEYVVAVARLQHFGKAAEACHVGQPTLSSQIRKLEDYLGIEIFERTKRSVRVTPAGEIIVAKGRELLQISDEIRTLAKELTDPLSGPLRLGAIPTIAPYLMPLLIPSFTDGLPGAELKISEHLTRELEAAVVGGEIDVAIIATEPEMPQLESIPLYDEPFWIALPSRHPLGVNDEVDISELENEQMLLLSDGHCLRDQVLSFCSMSDQVHPHIRTEDTSLTTILALVGGGLGVTLVPAMSIAGSWVTDSGITIHKERSGMAQRRVRLIYRRSFPRMQLLEKLADIIGAILPDTVMPQKR